MTRDDLATFLRIVPPQQRTWQTFDDARRPDGRARCDRRLTRVLHGSLTAVEPVLRRLNEPSAGAGVYLSSNLCDGHGRRTANITRVTALVGDFDWGMPVHVPVPPTLIIETSPGKFQAWWLLGGDDALSRTEQRDLHARLVAGFGADPRASGIARVYRVPGFWHLKREPFRVRIAGGTMCAVGRPTLLAAFPPLPEPVCAPTQSRPGKRPESRTLGGSFLAGGRLADGRQTSGLERLIAPLCAIDADDYATWIVVGLALHAETGGSSDGLALWDSWSANSAKYQSGACARRWAAFQPASGHAATAGKIYWLAAQQGWRG